MKTWTINSQKGGAGKSTLAINLATAASSAGKSVLLIDIDPQQSSVRWSRLRQDDNPVIVSDHAPNLPDILETAEKNGADLVIIDTAPHSESAGLEAAKLADIVLIPCKPSLLDLDSVSETVNVVKLAKKESVSTFILVDCKASTSLPEMAAEALGKYSIPLAPTRTGSRVAFIKSLTEGKGVVEFEPHGPAAKEIKAIYKHAVKLQGGKF